MNEPDWIATFLRESNAIDPQPTDRDPETPANKWHEEALLYAIQLAHEDRFALPREAHQLLLREDPRAGRVRENEMLIGFRETMPAKLIPRHFIAWNQRVLQVISGLRKADSTTEERRLAIWDLHLELMVIHPYELFNGKVGRILLVNHALLVDVEPWYVQCATERAEYFAQIRNHPANGSWKPRAGRKRLTRM